MKKTLPVIAILFFICFLTFSQHLVSVKQFGGTQNDHAFSTKTYANGNIFEVGSFSDTNVFGEVVNSLALKSRGLTDLFIAKYNSKGSLDWVKQGGGVDHDNAIVPAEVTTGKIEVSTISGIATSASDFIMSDLSPIISSFSPASGKPGSSVMISGENFINISSVKFNGITSVFSIKNSNEIIATVPENASTGKLSITSSKGTVESKGDFTVIFPPTITSISPTSGPIGTIVKITGAGYSSITSVLLNGKSIDFKVISPSEINAIIPNTAASGPIEVIGKEGNFLSKIVYTVSSLFTELILIPDFHLGSADWGDYDNDDDLDLLVTGKAVNEALEETLITKIYTNKGGSFSELSNTNFVGVRNSDAKWGDYDNDNDLDFIVSGLSSSQEVTKVYTNNGNGVFQELTISKFIGVFNSAVSWVDYDNDGDQDIFLTGDVSMVPYSKFYKNLGNGVFTEVTMGNIPGLTQASINWGDFDNDKDQDLLITGFDKDYLSHCSIFENIGNSFSKLNIMFPGVLNGNAEWGDYDGDGDLDFVMTGGISHTGLTKIFTNNGDKTFTEKSNDSLLQLGDGSLANGEITIMMVI